MSGKVERILRYRRDFFGLNGNAFLDLDMQFESRCAVWRLFSLGSASWIKDTLLDEGTGGRLYQIFDYLN